MSFSAARAFRWTVFFQRVDITCIWIIKQFLGGAGETPKIPSNWVYPTRLKKVGPFPPGQSVIINDGFKEVELETSKFVIDCDNGSIRVVGHERIPLGGLKDEEVTLEGKIVGELPEGLLNLFDVRVFKVVVDFTIEEPTGRIREVLNRPVLDRPIEESGIRLKIGDQTVHLRLAEIFPYGGRSFPYGDIQLGEAEGGFFSIVLKNPPGAE